jgi:hypothetical protein
MSQDRARYRRWKAGTRVQMVAPLMLSGKMPSGTVTQDAGPGDIVWLMRDDKPSDRRPSTCCTNEIVRLRNQEPNPGHQPPDGDWQPFWWMDGNR